MSEIIFIDWDGTLSKSRFWEQWKDEQNRIASCERQVTDLFRGRFLIFTFNNLNWLRCSVKLPFSATLVLNFWFAHFAL